MTYFAFLAWCVGIPLLILALLTWRDQRRGPTLPTSLQSWPATAVILAHISVAVLYTTPWDNYLVATGVWWYDPQLVTGLVLGWVPIEEYTFFVLQTLLTSLWVLYLARRLTVRAMLVPPFATYLRLGSTAVLGVLWVGSVIILATGWLPGTYLGLELVWALPPILLQLAFGADILWRYRRIVWWGIVVPTLYLSAGDVVAIGAGTWTIDPAQSTGIFLGGLPMEEFVFFLLTNTLVTFGTLLVLAQESHQRAPSALVKRMRQLVSMPG
ncbi:MAG: lycopene cyclase domain-containing protein [Caldilineaceae bacterium]|nr:lycopene cyclase domain-containing protein [Caldilineaceae bacterium]